MNSSRRTSLPLYQHPTYILAVDDHLPFLEGMQLVLSDSLPIKAFHNPVMALNWLRDISDVVADDSLVSIGYEEETPLADPGTIILDVGRIYKNVMKRERFHFPAVVVVDYAMPQMNGLDFCRALADLPCKKIWLTGEADEQIATRAFNEGLIDRYLKKSDWNVMERLKDEVAALTMEYFRGKSAIWNSLLERHAFRFLMDDAFIELVKILTVQHGFVERFLFADPAGMLFLDTHGKPSLMVIETKLGLISHLEAALEYDAPSELTSALQKAQVVPFFWESNGMYAGKSENWDAYCRPARVCKGKEDYYWALFDLPAKYLPNPIYSYQQFLRSRERVPA